MKKLTVYVCEGTGCVSSSSPEIRKKLEEETKRLGLEGSVEVKFGGCQGFCEMGPLVGVDPEGILYTRVKVEDAPEIVREHFQNGKPVERLFYVDPITNKPIPRYNDIQFYKKQMRWLLSNSGHINPENIDDYINVGGYRALKKALEMTPEGIIEEIKRSGLRGRGGAGFPTWKKWKFCREAGGTEKYIICNADEGDPGAFMDRSLLESNPHSVIEGMIIGAYAIGAQKGVMYIRAEYPLAVERVKKALAQARERGFLGKNILGSGFDVMIDVECGSGAFVAGEETAVLSSIEGRRAEPRQRPPYPAQKGLWGKPTNMNNVKTWASVPLIISNGADWFSSIGTKTSKGTMIFSVAGKVNHSGLVEVPMGMTLRELIFEMGGGIPNGKKIKAVQTGGPSGGCIPESLLDLPIDYESLTAAGSIMGSGGIVVMDEDTCMVDIAKFFLSFSKDESCGKCTPCREGMRRMHELLMEITEGRGKDGDMAILKEMSSTIIDSSLCALGGTAPNPVLSTIRYFGDEYEAHIKEKRCPSLVCKSLISYYIDPEKCKACTICLRNCSANAIEGGKDQIHVINQSKCTKCGTCFDACPTKVIVKLSGVGVPPPLPIERRTITRRG